MKRMQGADARAVSKSSLILDSVSPLTPDTSSVAATDSIGILRSPATALA